MKKSNLSCLKMLQNVEGGLSVVIFFPLFLDRVEYLKGKMSEMNSGADGVTPPKKSKMRPLSTSTPAARATSSREGETSHLNSSRNSNKNRGFKRKYNGLVQVS